MYNSLSFSTQKTENEEENSEIVEEIYQTTTESDEVVILKEKIRNMVKNPDKVENSDFIKEKSKIQVERMRGKVL